MLAPQAGVNVGGGESYGGGQCRDYASSRLSPLDDYDDGGAAVLSETLTDFIKAVISPFGSREIRFGESAADG